jgi:CheY-like chemotaxis protein
MRDEHHSGADCFIFIFARMDVMVDDDRVRRCLIVDDNEEEPFRLIQLFESLGLKAFATWSGRDALDYLASHQFDLLLVDQFLADVYVGELIERVLRLANPPRIAIMNSGEKDQPIKYDKSLGEVRSFDKTQRGQTIGLCQRSESCGAPVN